jgi:hypothetical protein
VRPLLIEIYEQENGPLIRVTLPSGRADGR